MIVIKLSISLCDFYKEVAMTDLLKFGSLITIEKNLSILVLISFSVQRLVKTVY